MIKLGNAPDTTLKFDGSFNEGSKTPSISQPLTVSQISQQNNQWIIQLSSANKLPKLLQQIINRQGSQAIQWVLADGNTLKLDAQIQQHTSAVKNSFSIQLSQAAAKLLMQLNLGQQLQLTTGKQGQVVVLANSTTPLSANQPTATTNKSVTATFNSPAAAHHAQPSPQQSHTVQQAQPVNNHYPSQTANNSVVIANNIISQQLKAALPHQQGFQHLTSHLQQLTQHIDTVAKQTGSHSPATTTLQHSIQQLLSVLPTIEQLQTTQGLKHAMLDSGMFLEQKLALLAQVTGPQEAQQAISRRVESDVKTQLLRLATAILHTPYAPQQATQNNKPHLDPMVMQLLLFSKQLPQHNEQENSTKTERQLKQLAKQLAGNIAATEVNQLDASRSQQNQAVDTPKMLSWTTELAINNDYIDNLTIKIEKDQQSGTEQELVEQWRVNLAFDLHDKGKLNILLSIIDNSVGAQLWSEKSTMHQIVSQYLYELENMLTDAGVHVKELNCYEGIPQLANNQLERYYLHKHLIDVKT